ncbi:MAG: rod shape-determining protein MreD [Candidatus Omnitrophica bacterium]|nr:rod shape-determining protein MreD [Candidatus Omnitrophota bacterium]MCM8771071.1 rod shape-determining protein MreD [Candidatus Omnitrophota bacterium]
MRKEFFLFIYLLIFALLESTILNYFRVFGAKPDLLLVSIVVFGLYLSNFWIITLSCFAGLLLDIFCFYSFGINTILFCSIGIICKKISRNLYIENNSVIISLVFLASIIAGIVRGSLISGMPFVAIFKLCLPQAFYTAIFCPFVFRVLSIFPY